MRIFKNKVLSVCFLISTIWHVLFFLSISLVKEKYVYGNKLIADSSRGFFQDKQLDFKRVPDYSLSEISLTKVDLVSFSLPVGIGSEKFPAQPYVRSWDNTKEDFLFEDYIDTMVNDKQDLTKELEDREILIDKQSLERSKWSKTEKDISDSRKLIKEKIYLSNNAYQLVLTEKFLREESLTGAESVVTIEGKIFIKSNGLVKSVFIEKGTENKKLSREIVSYLKRGKVLAEDPIVPQWLNFSFYLYMNKIET